MQMHDNCGVKRMIKVICKTCGKEFLAKPCDIKRGRKYCSEKCYLKSRLTGKQITCKYCGKVFYATKKAISRYNAGKYCSWDCFKKDKSRNLNLIKVRCDYCGKYMYKWKNHIERTNHNFCSQKCKADFQKGKIPYNKGLGGVQVKCINCGKIFKVSPIRIKRGVKFCSNKCRYEYQIGENSPMFGKKNPMWQGGLTSKLYPSEFSNQLKELIRHRDGYKCQKCGMPEIENGRKLAIHHIDYNKENCKPNNLISLCNRCNLEVNTNRKKWMKYFNRKVKKIMNSNVIQLNFRYKNIKSKPLGR